MSIAPVSAAASDTYEQAVKPPGTNTPNPASTAVANNNDHAATKSMDVPDRAEVAPSAVVACGESAAVSQPGHSEMGANATVTAAKPTAPAAIDKAAAPQPPAQLLSPSLPSSSAKSAQQASPSSAAAGSAQSDGTVQELLPAGAPAPAVTAVGNGAGSGVAATTDAAPAPATAPAPAPATVIAPAPTLAAPSAALPAGAKAAPGSVASTPKATPAKARTPRQPAKQKRKTNQAGSKATDLVHTGPSTVGGTIGAAPDHVVPGLLGAGGGGRKALPDHVMPFALPSSTIRPDHPLLNTAGAEEREAYIKKAKLNNGRDSGVASTPPPQRPAGTGLPASSMVATAAAPVAPQGRSVSRQIKQPSVEMSDSSDSDTFSSVSDSDEEERKRKREPASVGESLVLLQSLRQSRLSHLSSLLPPFSQKVRSGMIYPNVLPLSLLHGLNPREPHVLIQLGRADIQVGPHIFVKTKFWEVRPDVELAATGPGHVESFTGPYGQVKRTTVIPIAPKQEPTVERKEPLPDSKAATGKPHKGADPTASASSATATPNAKAPPSDSTMADSTSQRRHSTNTLQLIAPKPAPPATATPAVAVANAGGPALTPSAATTPASAIPAVTAGADAGPKPSPVLIGNKQPQQPQPPFAIQSQGQPAPGQAKAVSATGAAQQLAAAAVPPLPATTARTAAPATGVASTTPAVTAMTMQTTTAAAAPRAMPPVAPKVAAVPTSSKTPAPAPAPAPASLTTAPTPGPAVPKPSLPTSASTSAAGPTATASQPVHHVQFAPARLSPISQSSTQQTAPRSAQSTPAVASPAASRAPGRGGVASIVSGGGVASAPASRPATTSATAAPAATPVTSKGPLPMATPGASILPAAKNLLPPGTAAPVGPTARPMPPAAVGPRPLQPTPVAARPPAPPGAQPAIDAVLVSRVNATAALNPELQQLLHVAASGKANPEQLKSLGVWIQAITAQLREDEARAAATNKPSAAAGSSIAKPSSSSAALSAGGAKQPESGAGTGATATAAKAKAKGKAKDGAPAAANGQPAVDKATVKKPKKSKADAEQQSSMRAAKKAAKAEEKEAKKKAAAAAKAEAKAAAAAQKSQQQQQHQHQHQSRHQQQLKPRQLPPGWPTDGPPRPPIIVVEFRENPSMRFVLPLWKCVVERREGVDPASVPKVKRERGFFDDFIEDDDDSDDDVKGIEPELKLSFFVPSIGSDAAGTSGASEIEEIEAARKQVEAESAAAAAAAAQQQQQQQQQNCSRTGSLDGTVTPDRSHASGSVSAMPDPSTTAAGKGQSSKKTQPKKLEDGVKARAQAQAEAEAAEQSKRHGQFPASWSITGGVTESMWEAFGRVPGVITNAVVRPVKIEPEIELAPDVAEFLVPEIRYRLLDQPDDDLKLHKEIADAFVDLCGQLPDRRFVLPCIAPVHIPFGLEDHLSDKFAVRPQIVAARPVAKRKAGVQRDELDMLFSFGGIAAGAHSGVGGAATGGVDSAGGLGAGGAARDFVKGETEPTPTKPPKRKRHVATHNPDGSIKSCGACGKTKTPMWRRGPKGPSQLCNACGARWKAGRLVVPEVAPPPIIEAEGDKVKEEGEKHGVTAEQPATHHGVGGGAGGIDGPSLANGHGAMGGAVVIPMGSSAAAMSSMPATTFAPATGVVPFVSAAMSAPSSVAYQHHLVSMTEVGPMDLDASGFGGMGLTGPGAPGPSPFIRSPNPYPGHESIPASVDPSVLFGGSSHGV